MKIHLATACAAVAGCGELLSGAPHPPSLASSGFRGIADAANLPLFALVLAALSLIVLPAVNYFRDGWSGRGSLCSDITGDALAFVSSMEKLAEINPANKAPNKIIEFIFTATVRGRPHQAGSRPGRTGGLVTTKTQKPKFCGFQRLFVANVFLVTTHPSAVK